MKIKMLLIVLAATAVSAKAEINRCAVNAQPLSKVNDFEYELSAHGIHAQVLADGKGIVAAIVLEDLESGVKITSETPSSTTVQKYGTETMIYTLALEQKGRSRLDLMCTVFPPDSAK